MILSLRVLSLAVTLMMVFFLFQSGEQQSKQLAWQAEWNKTLEAAKKEGKVTISIPASPEMCSSWRRI
jgi:hypothetical protein